MSNEYNQGEVAPQYNDLTNIHGSDPNLLPDIPTSDNVGGSQAVPTGFLALTASTPINGGEVLVTETLPMSTKAATNTIPTQPSTSTTPAASTPAASTPTPKSQGLPPTTLAAAIIVPIAFLAVVVPIIVFWILNHRRKLSEQKHASHRNSHSRLPMIEKLREPMIERQPSYKGPAPARPLRTPAGTGSRQQTLHEPPAAQTRDSLGLFNFGLSPTTPRTPKSSRTPESEASPDIKFSVARTLEMRRSQPSVIQPHARTSDNRVTSNPSATNPAEPQTRNPNRESVYDPPPPYASPRPSEAVVARSHFAPLERIGTRNIGERSPPRVAGQARTARLSEVPDRSTYASSDAIRDSDTYALDRTRSSSPSMDWPPPPQPQGVLARKPIPSQATRVTSHSTSPHDESHLNGPFDAYLPDRMSDISGFSIDTARWGGQEPSRQNSTASSVQSAVSPIDSDTSTIQPHHLV